MTDQLNAAQRDEVLFAFHQECPRPTADDILQWTKRHPELADEIIEHAALRLDSAAMEGEPEEEIEEVLLARGHSRALNALYNAQRAAEAKGAEGESATFDSLMASAGKSVPLLARELDVGRDVLSDLVSGRMLKPIGKRLAAAVMGAVHASETAFQSAVDYALANQRLGMAKANRQPTVVARPYEEIVRRSSMSDERIAYWLGED
ncbi:MAG: hypothetical protein Q7U20_07775 [Caulobacter sp.]|nr:hypothetical protein [Caulobacter sp.]